MEKNNLTVIVSSVVVHNYDPHTGILFYHIWLVILQENLII